MSSAAAQMGYANGDDLIDSRTLTRRRANEALRIAAIAAMASFGGIFANAGNAAPAAGAPVVRALVTPASKLITIERIIGAITIIGTDTLIGAATIIGIDTLIGAPITVDTIITTGIHIIGNAKKPNKNRGQKAGVRGRLFD